MIMGSLHGMVRDTGKKGVIGRGNGIDQWHRSEEAGLPSGEAVPVPPTSLGLLPTTHWRQTAWGLLLFC